MYIFDLSLSQMLIRRIFLLYLCIALIKGTQHTFQDRIEG